MRGSSGASEAVRSGADSTAGVGATGSAVAGCACEEEAPTSSSEGTAAALPGDARKTASEMQPTNKPKPNQQINRLKLPLPIRILHRQWLPSLVYSHLDANAKVRALMIQANHRLIEAKLDEDFRLIKHLRRRSAPRRPTGEAPPGFDSHAKRHRSTILGDARVAEHGKEFPVTRSACNRRFNRALHVEPDRSGKCEHVG